MKVYRRNPGKDQKKLKRLRTLMVLILVSMCLLLCVILFFTIREFTSNSKNNTSSTVSQVETISQEDADKMLTLVNVDHQLSSSFKLDLVDFSTVKVDRLITEQLSNLLNDAKAAGYELEVSVGYVDKQTQQSKYEALVSENIASGMTSVKASEQAMRVEPQGNCCDMQTGLSVDIVKKGGTVSDDFVDTIEYKWLASNCVHYGFIQRYPEDKTTETCMDFHPCRYRYVGTENAEQMRRLNMSFEKYYEHLNSR